MSWCFEGTPAILSFLGSVIMDVINPNTVTVRSRDLIFSLTIALIIVCVYIYMGVSKNRGTPKSSILIGFSIVNHPFGVPLFFGNAHIYIYGTPPKKKPTFCHFLTVFTVFCNLFGTLNFEANFEGGPYIYIYGTPPSKVYLFHGHRGYHIYI